MVASATRGPEAEQWREAAKWLELVEKDAATATELTHRLSHAEKSGQQDETQRLMRELREIEAKYSQRFGTLQDA